MAFGEHEFSDKENETHADALTRPRCRRLDDPMAFLRLGAE